VRLGVAGNHLPRSDHRPQTVIEEGSVVTRDIPAAAFVAGNPCRVVREITD
jgi:maltose O-acetyltransferase